MAIEMIDEASDQPTEPANPILGRTLRLVAVLVVGLLFFSLTTPKSIPSVLLVGGFVALAAMLYALIRLTLIGTGLEQRLSPAYRRGIILAGTAMPVLLLMLQSIGQLTLRDVLTLGGLCLLGVFYVGRVVRPRT